MRRLLYIPTFLLLLLGACSTIDAARETVKLKGAEAADQGLLDAEWYVCKVARVGAVKRRYGQTVETAQTYRQFCEGDGQANVTSPK